MQRLRQGNGLSLDALAARANLAKGTLVAVERGEANPSISVLCKLAAAFDVSLANLLEPEGPYPPIKRLEQVTPETLWASGNGGEAILTAAMAGPGMFELWSWRLAAGETYTIDVQRPGRLELVHVRQGKLEISIGDSSLQLNEGSSARLRADEPHHYRAIGETGAVFSMSVLEGWKPRQAF